jgi:hypothetical protein
MMEIDDVVVNDPDVHLQSSDLVAVFENSVRYFCSYAWTEVLWMSCGVLILM